MPTPHVQRPVRLVFWSLAIVTVATFALFHSRPKISTSGSDPELPEAERSALVLEAGRLRQAGKLFTGRVVEHYPDGTLQSRSAVSNGQLHGISEGWHTNGVLQVREHFVRSVSHGVRLRWDEQGRKVSEATIVGGKLQGAFRRWHENGLLAEEATMQYDVPDGLSRAWYPSGCLKMEVLMVKGQIKSRRSYMDGEAGDLDVRSTGRSEGE